MSKRSKFSPDPIDWDTPSMRKKLEEMRTDDLAAELNRTPQAINRQRRKMGIKGPPRRKPVY